MQLLSTFLEDNPRTILVEVVEVKGSTPREAGAWMLVSETGLHGTIGGGAFEYMAIDHARALLAGRADDLRRDIPLGPAIGQCCGGFVSLSFSVFDAAARTRLETRLKAETETHPAVFVFGAGHVGKALASALLPLPFAVTVVETRREELQGLPEGVATRLSALPEAEATAIPPGGAAIIVTHDHALDFLIAWRALARTDLFYTGMIGSATKRATFARWFVSEGGEPAALDRLVLPIGGSAVRDKRPAVIAAMVAAELLRASASRAAASPLPALSAERDRP
ncbi:xanthine dehydrogenase accessory protein XdhC [Rhizobiaceae bacterium BDR2-2]|uniref:Xanthine dehydrogenase accessory protein XdhC n=1 Tax=Ectorhizobium quercum TaxID=2965071 RepID=A0AAE3MYY1_9HYPH|nr:xanthine dehydrogenase accessory protein XdhC [Ectorhizobium quercum]MCX8996644.1 xanthine dehydrogenase accessory protein XdhC [Ectorhizobium quercum]